MKIEAIAATYGLCDPPPDKRRRVPSFDELERSVERQYGAYLPANASIPGQLKNALDWASRPYPDNALRQKPVAVVGVSTGVFGAVWAQAELRKVLATAGAHVLDDELAISTAHDAFDRDLTLTDRVLSTRLEHILAKLQVRAIREIIPLGDGSARAPQ